MPSPIKPLSKDCNAFSFCSAVFVSCPVSFCSVVFISCSVSFCSVFFVSCFVSFCSVIFNFCSILFCSEGNSLHGLLFSNSKPYVVILLIDVFSSVLSLSSSDCIFSINSVFRNLLTDFNPISFPICCNSAKVFFVNSSCPIPFLHSILLF